MRYRRAPRNPPTLLLRIVAAAGAGTVLGMASCGGEPQIHGLTPLSEPADAQVDDSGSPLLGAIGMADSSGIALPDHDGPLGLVLDPDASVADAEVHGVAPLPDDAGSDAHKVIIGVVVEPHDAGHDSGSTLACPPLCGVVIGVVPNPGH